MFVSNTLGWQSLVNDACQPDLHSSPCTLSWRRRKNQLPVQGDQSLTTGHCSSQWLKGQRSIPDVKEGASGCWPEHYGPDFLIKVQGSNEREVN